ncbi:MAG: winged helix DNA-binding protein [Pseudomonadota bacterium]
MTDPDLGPVVSSAHLADGPHPQVSEFEFGLIVARHSFDRWMVRAMTAAGYPELSPLDVLVLHTVRHRDRPKTLADICLVLNVEDTHTVNYALKKLAGAGLIETGKQGKEKTASITEAGLAACDRYRQIRDELLLTGMDGLGAEVAEFSRLSALLRLMSGQYDQAARAATTF